MSKTLLIRADANGQIGTGHLMRCLALGQSWKSAGGDVFFITACPVESLVRYLGDEGFRLQLLDHGYPDRRDWEVMAKILDDQPGAWLVLDGYQFDEAYQKQIKETGHRLCVIDDMAHRRYYHADMIVNQNVHAQHLQYSCEPHTRLLLGTRYVLLRKEFLKWRRWRRHISPTARKILVTLGGSDPNNATERVIQVLHRLEGVALEAALVIGDSNPRYQQLRHASQQLSFPIRLERNSRDMSEIMAWADVAVAGSGTTSWELVFMQLPFLALVLAENQRAIADSLDRQGVAVAAGEMTTQFPERVKQLLSSLLGDETVRSRMVERSRALVDGEGSARVLMELTGNKFRLRKMAEDDCRLVWEWANDPVVRAASFSSEAIPWERHVEWFTSKINDPECMLYIALDGDDVPIGQVRYEILNNEATISISLDPRFRGQGYGSALIGQAANEFFDTTSIPIIHAFVKAGNEDSLRAFMKNNFQKRGTTAIRGCPAVHLVLGRNGVKR